MVYYCDIFVLYIVAGGRPIYVNTHGRFGICIYFYVVVSV
jgi:hypothetical protein